MDVKHGILNGQLQDEMYVEKPPGFYSHLFPDHVYQLNKALYALKQSSRAWHETLSKFLIDHDVVVGIVEKDFILIQ